VTVIDFTAFIGRLATSSGETHLPFFRTSLSIDNKSNNHDFDPVTEADRAAEAVMRRLIKANFPQARHRRRGIRQRARRRRICLGAGPDRRHQVLHRGFRSEGTLIALLHKGTPVFGMMHQPFIGERFPATRARRLTRGRRANENWAVRRCASLREAPRSRPARC